ncbi:MAG: hypothetical protein KGR21_07280 [Proteobacteria bacterium]|nr:hypothetical protein [Pseudomonadota bacterium]
MNEEALNKCLEECRNWNNLVLNRLSESQRVEYSRQVAYFEATKEYYRSSLQDAAELDGKHKVEKRLAFLGGVIVILAFVFELVDSIFTDLTVGIGFTILVYFAVVSSVHQRETSVVIRGIERDFAAMGISLIQVYKCILKEARDEDLRELESLSDAEKIRIATESAVLNYFFRNALLDRITNYEHGASPAEVAAEILR